ncbi:hypothetical protein PFISCL1PPCAC_12737, partial [Pristionchus fissidentatus]
DDESFSEKEGHVRDCLICGRPTRYVHMGIDACRACAIFYKRIKNRKRPLVCRTGSLECDTMKNDKYSCKKCRFDRITVVLRESRKPKFESSLLTEEENAPSTSKAKVICFAPPAPKMKRETAHVDVISGVRRGHSLMNTIRRTSELSTRTCISADQAILVEGVLVIPTTYLMMNQTTRILLSAMFEFASTAFDEFKDLEHKEQWQLIRNFYIFFITLDSAYRMQTKLPDRETMCFTSYATYLDFDTLPAFLSDTPSSKNREEATRMMHCYLEHEVRHMRLKMKRWNPSDDEYMAFLGLSFWSLEKVEVGEHVHQIAEIYRRSIFVQLDKLYREKMQLNDYSAHMGEGLLFLVAIQSAFYEMRYKLEIFKLLDIFDDQMLMYQLHDKVL